MTPAQLRDLAGIKGLHKLSEHTTTVVFPNGAARPATPLEIRLWQILTRLSQEN